MNTQRELTTRERRKAQSKERISWRRTNRISQNAIEAVDSELKTEFVRKVLFAEHQAPYNRAKLMFVGAGRAGKTSTVNALLSEDFNHQQESTRGMNVQRTITKGWSAGHLQQKKNNDVRKSNKVYGAEQINFLQKQMTKEERDEFMFRSMKSMKEDSSRIARGSRKIYLTNREVEEYGKSIEIGENSLLNRKLKNLFTDTELRDKKKEQENLIKPTFSIYDFGGQKVFYSMHHLFLTEHGCYLLVFNIERLLNEFENDAMGNLEAKIQTPSVEYLKFWLNSKKLNAPNAPILLVGTHSPSDGNVMEKLKLVDKILLKSVFKSGSKFNDRRNEKSSLFYFPVDNSIKYGVSALRRKIDETILGEDFIRESVPVSYLRCIDLMMDTGSEILFLESEVMDSITYKCGIEGENIDEMLDFLSERGLIIHFSIPVGLRKFIILDPQFLIDGMTQVIYDPSFHKDPQFDDHLLDDFRHFIDSRIISKELLFSIWKKKGHKDEVCNLFLSIMKASLLVSKYEFGMKEQFLIPQLFDFADSGVATAEELDEEEDFSGLFFMIDFSGDFSDVNENCVKFLPFGLFEKLICLCIGYSAKVSQSTKPSIKQGKATISFGTDVDLQLSLENNLENERAWIKVATEKDTSTKTARHVMTVINSMLESLRDDYFSSGISSLTITLLLPNKKGELTSLANLVKINDARQSNQKKFRPNLNRRYKAKTADYNHWFPGLKHYNSERILDPDREFREIRRRDPSLLSIKRTTSKGKGLPRNLKYHCFLSYKQASAADTVGKLYYLLQSRGYRSWFDQHFQGDISNQAMEKGVKASLCYVLMLSEGVFNSAAITHEINCAIKYKKEIIFLHHPKTGEPNYCSFNDYIEEAPEILRQYFGSVESLRFERRYYLEDAMMKILTKKIDEARQQYRGNRFESVESRNFSSEV
eukprot:snap_masked-scaffold_14-processed-gene-9.0-mRNA-1 protein AED:0.45 eAED:0.53 QI:0/-1/0/1/-1/1/1/0/929